MSASVANSNGSDLNSEDQKLKFAGILKSNGITDEIKQVVVKDAGLQGEGFASQTKCITVTFENPWKKPLNLFAKVVTTSKSHTAFLEELKAFEKEGLFLTEYVSAAEKMCKAKGCEGPSALYPKCYYADNNMVILENLVLDKGYCLLNKSERQDLDAAEFALITLAKHHAISYAMIQEEGGAEKFFKRFPNLDYEGFDKPQFIDMMQPICTNSLNLNLKILKNNEVEGKEEALSILEPFKNASLYGMSLADLKKHDEGDLLVLNHGDYWNNNMMFLKDKQTNKIIAHKAIDLQITRYNSPGLDLSYFFYTSVKTDVRIAHLKHLLQLYLKTLKEVSSELGHPISMSFEELFLMYRKRLNFGYWIAMSMVIGPGMDVFKDFDVSKIDVKDWALVMDQLMSTWIDENPDYCKIIAREVVQIAKEYRDLRVD